MQHQPGVLYYGYLTPFVNMSVYGFLWYQGELLGLDASTLDQIICRCSLQKQANKCFVMTAYADVGENNCGMENVGNSVDGTGYGCELPAMVASWRKIWSSTSGTTDPMAPFGIATLAAGGSEGNNGHIANMRWSEQANYGVWDNPALPNTFGAQISMLAKQALIKNA